jgi:hypothetical protein
MSEYRAHSIGGLARIAGVREQFGNLVQRVDQKGTRPARRIEHAQRLQPVAYSARVRGSERHPAKRLIERLGEGPIAIRARTQCMLRHARDEWLRCVEGACGPPGIRRHE